MIKLAYLGIDILLPVLEAVLQEDCEILQVFSCPTDNVTEFNTGVIALAKEHNISYTINKITTADLNNLKEHGCDLLLCAGYYYRVPVFDGFPMINVHPSYLPIGRGAWPMPVSILRGLAYGGVTFHKMDADYDTGDIVLQQRFPLSEQETLISYMDKLYQKVPEMVRQLCKDYKQLIAKAVPQGKGEYWKCPTSKDWTIDSAMPVKQADLILRAFFGYECIYKSYGGSYEIIGARAMIGETKGQQFPLRDGYLTTDRYRRISENGNKNY